LELRDFIVTPILIVIVYGVAYFVRPFVTDLVTRRYFIPAITVRILGALVLGLIYQYYYNGGDTFNFHTHGSRHVWEAFVDSPLKGLKLIFASGNPTGVYQYSSRIIFFNDPASYFIIRIASLFDLVTFSAYSGTAILFSVFGFTGAWMFFLTFYKQYPSQHRWLAISCLFLPSVVFWGSGLLKDTITLACLSVATFYFYKIFFERKFSVGAMIILLAMLFAIFSVRKFILQAYLPAVILWIFVGNFYKVRSPILRVATLPVVAIIVVASAYYTVIKVGEGDRRYSVNKLVSTAQITAYDIRFFTGRNAGSGYTLGVIENNWQSMLRLAPGAINVSLFRPYLWEVKNPLMLISSLESVFLLFLTLYVVIKKRGAVFSALNNPNVIFLLVFSLVFAFAVGVSTFNFGTLVRYKIPLLPAYTTALVIILNLKTGDYENRVRKL